MTVLLVGWLLKPFPVGGWMFSDTFVRHKLNRNIRYNDTSMFGSLGFRDDFVFVIVFVIVLFFIVFV